MKSVMIINENQSNIDEIKSMLEDEDISIISVDNNRSGINQLADHQDIDLILLSTKHPDSSEKLLMSLNPGSDFSTDMNNSEFFLSKPFTKEQITTFVKNHIK